MAGDARSLRVCSPQLGLDPNANLGGAVYDRELLRAMVSLGADVDVLLPEGSPVDDAAGWHVHRTPRHQRSYYEYNWIFYGALRRHWTHHPADVLRVHSPYSVGPGALLFARQARVPAVLHYLHHEPRRVWDLIDRHTLHRYDLIVTISQATERDLKARLPRTRVVVALPGVDESYAPDPVAKQPDSGPLTAAYVGGLLPRKNLTLALKGVAAARSRGIDVRFVIAGEGPLEPALRAEASALGIADHTTFVGRIDETTKRALLQRADVFLFPSILEGFGMAAAEALACGTPVIGLGTTATAEIVKDGATGILLRDGGDHEAMAQAIATLAASVDLRRRMGDAGAADVRQRLSWRSSAAQVLEAYEALVRPRAAR